MVVPELDDTAQLLLVELQKDDPEEVADALNTLSINLINDQAGQRAHTMKRQMLLGAPSLVVLSMQKWQNTEAVQYRGCWCIQELATNVTESSDTLNAIAASGGIEAVVNAMRLFSTSSTVQEAGCDALLEVSCPLSTGSPIEAGINRLVNEMGGVALALNAMKKFPENSDIQSSCCGFFANLATRKEYRKEMMQSGVVSAVAATLERQTDDKNVKEWSGEFMRLMFARND